MSQRYSPGDRTDVSPSMPVQQPGRTSGATPDMPSSTAESMKENVSAVTETVATRVDAQRDSVAGGLHSVASTLRDKAGTIPGGERTTQAAATAAEKLDSTAGYLREHQMSDMMGDLQRLVRQHPTESLAVAVAAGFLLGRMLRD